MLKLLLGLSPPLLMLISSLSGAGLALTGAKLWNDWVDNPGIVRTQEAICLSRVETAASEARRLEQYRQYAAGRAAAEEFIKQQLAAEKERQAQIEELENEITAYEQRLTEEGRSCRLSPSDLQFLNGL